MAVHFVQGGGLVANGTKDFVEGGVGVGGSVGAFAAEVGVRGPIQDGVDKDAAVAGKAVGLGGGVSGG